MGTDITRHFAPTDPQFYDPPRPWLAMPELTVRIRGLRPSTTTYDIWKDLSSHGKVILIELFENQYGNRDGQAKARFSPPPKEQFWAKGTYQFRPADGKSSYRIQVRIDWSLKRMFQVQSPLRRSVFYDEQMKMSPTTLDFGVMLYPNTMMKMQTIVGDGTSDISFLVDLRRNKIITAFEVLFRDPRNDGFTDFASTSSVGQYDRTNKYMFQIPFGHLERINLVEINDSTFSLVISLDGPPEFFRRKEDGEAVHSNESLFWNEFECWFRQTDIVYDRPRLQTIPISLQKEAPVIDIGHWTTYRFVFHHSRGDDLVYKMMREALQDFNIEIVPLAELKVVASYTTPPSSLINTSKAQHATMNLKNLGDGNGTSFLPFEVRYQLEACISWGILNEHNIPDTFVTKLAEIASRNPFKARTILEYIMERDERIYHPMGIFEDKEALEYSPNTEIPHYCAYSRKATITPTRIYFGSPTIACTNRVLRHYAGEHKDGRFLRVQFTDEISQGRINSCADKKQNDEIFTRIYRTLINGIQVGERLYRFLAFGNAQFRENGAYFFCPTDQLSCDDIRQWMGNFSHINVVAKYAARIGQCFSTARAINNLTKPKIVRIPDIEKGRYCFTDGVGKISPFLAQMIAAEFSLRIDTTPVPSAFQFRLGGCKGILVVSPDAKEREVHIRRSQEKFTAIYNGLEIIRYSQFCSATLNRQTITLLSSLGVPDEVFLKMLSNQLSNYQDAMSNNKLALSLLSKYIDDNRMTINIASMVLNGFMKEGEPFVLTLLDLWRAWSIKLLKEKARILVEKGALVLGCVDETATLRGYTRAETGDHHPKEQLPQIFIQVPDKNASSQYSVIKGICIVGRNPSLHPGDLRVVEAVDIPALHHLRDVVVFPQTGDRDIPSMCSGGDLDGDDYFVIWDEDLLPHPEKWNRESMSYAAPAPMALHRPVAVADLMKFFVKYMKNDALPVIAHAHLAQSDYLVHGVRDQKCLDLAALHSKAVDYVKTGQPAEMPKHLHATKWPHFMEKIHKPKNVVYHSQNVLGQLYDRVERVSFVPRWQAPFDKRILKAYKLEDATLEAARQIKRKYDTAMRRIMVQQEIKTEFEVWTTFVLSRPRVGSDYKMQEVVGRISGNLKDQFRRVCIEKAGGKEFATLGPFVAAMYKVTKEELDIALAECRSTKYVGGWEVPKRKMEPKFMPFISFPWLFEKKLGRIATGVETNYDLDDFGLISLIAKKSTSRAQYQQDQGSEIEDYIQQDNGDFVRRNEELILFPEEESDNSATDESDDYVVVSYEQDKISTAKTQASPMIDAHTAQSMEMETSIANLNSDSLLDISDDDIVNEEIIFEESLEVDESLPEKLARLTAS